MRSRVALSVGLSLALAAPAAPRPAPVPASAVRAQFLTMFARAYYPGRSGQIMVVPREGEIITRTGADVPFMHGSPWDYDTRIPVLFWGPGRIRSGVFHEPVDQEAVAPTLARVLGTDMTGVTGRPVAAVLQGGASVPKAVVLLVLDGFRADYLDGHASAMPTLVRLRKEGAFFDQARVSHLPTITSIGHATIATGTEPRFHGIVANTLFDRREGKGHESFEKLSPRNLMARSLSDLWNAETNGKAVILVQTSVTQAGGLAGHGSCLFGAGPVVYASYSRVSGAWETDATCFRLPDYLASASTRALWERSPTWMGHAIGDPDAVRRGAPFATFEGDALVALLEREPLGADAVPDLVMANLKVVDYVGHAYGPESPEMAEALAEQDRQLGRILGALEKKVGRDYVLAITADHGMPPEPGAGHGRHYVAEIVKAIHQRFDPQEKLVPLYPPEDGQLVVDRARLADLGLTLGQVRDFIQSQPFVFAAFTEDEVRAAAARPPSSAGGSR